MKKEDYVSFETAKLLKDRKFPQEYDMFHSLMYNEDNYEDEYEVNRMFMTSYRTNEEIIRKFCEENLTIHANYYGTWVETKNNCSSVEEFVKKLMQHIENNHDKC